MPVNNSPPQNLIRRDHKVSIVEASVIVAVYNGEKTLSKTIESILNQTYTNFELILVDDGSSDGSATLIERYLGDERVKYYKKENGGVASARNFGIEKANGRFIGFCDQDDQWLPEKLSKQLPLFNDDDVGLVYSWVNVDTHGVLTKTTPEYSGDCFEALLNENFISCCSAMVRKSCIEKVGGLEESRALHGVDDRHLWLKVARIAKLAVVKEPLAVYFIHGENYSLNEAKMLEADLLCIDMIENTEGLDSQQKKLCELGRYNIYKHYAHNFFYQNDTTNVAKCLFSAWRIKPWHLELLLASMAAFLTVPVVLKKIKQIRKRAK